MARDKKVDAKDVDLAQDPEVGAVAPRGESPQQYDGGDVPAAVASLPGNSEVDNTTDKPAPEILTTATIPATTTTVKVEQPEHEQLKGAKIKLTEKAYINDVLYDAGSVIESYSGPKAPYMVVVK